MAQVIYNGKDITGDVEITELIVTDSCGDQADGISAKFANSENQWSAWKPKKSDNLNITHEGYRAGTMWIDRVRQETGLIGLSAVSIPPGGKTKRTKAWERATLTTIAAERAAAYGLKAKFIGVPNFTYARVDQFGRGDFGFLQERAALEGCSIKIQDDALYLFSDVFMEGVAAARTIDAAEFLEEARFDENSSEIYGSCTVSWQFFSATFSDPAAEGPELIVTDVPVSSAGEALRFAKNLLRSKNKKEMVGELSISLDKTISAGNTVNVTGTGYSDGKYFIDTMQDSFAEEISRLTVHRCFTRY